MRWDREFNVALLQGGKNVGGLFEISGISVDKHLRLHIDLKAVKVFSVVGDDERLTKVQADLKAFDQDELFILI